MTLFTGIVPLYGSSLLYVGPVGVVWGWVVVTFFTWFVGFAMAEICSSFPVSSFFPLCSDALMILGILVYLLAFLFYLLLLCALANLVQDSPLRSEDCISWALCSFVWSLRLHLHRMVKCLCLAAFVFLSSSHDCFIQQTTGSLYFWAAHLSGPRWGPLASWICAWLEAIGLIAGVGTQVFSVCPLSFIIGSQLWCTLEKIIGFLCILIITTILWIEYFWVHWMW